MGEITRADAAARPRPGDGNDATQTVNFVASGAWTLNELPDLEMIEEQWASAPRRSIVIDAGQLTAMDTFGAQTLVALRRMLRAAGHAADIVGLPEKHARLLNFVGAIAPAGPSEPEKDFDRGLAARLFASVLRARDEVLSLLNTLGSLAYALANVTVSPKSFRVTSLVHQLDRAGLQAVPIIALITLLIGSIIAQQGFFHFRKFGADEYVVDMVGILVLREIGVLIVAIMVAGRSGSAYTAELGSMKLRDEIDSLSTMGLDPLEVLALPRVLALVIALPLLTFLGSIAALSGGVLTGWLYGNMHPEVFVTRLKDAISLTHFEVGMIKAPFMALVIGTVACAEGLRASGSSESVGRQTTSSVVKSIFAVIVLDGLFAVFFAAIGM